MGGLISSAVLTLVALPYVNLLIEYISEWLQRMWQLSGGVGAVPRQAESATVVEAAG